MNNNITEDYCSFEVAKLLRNKGFAAITQTYYNSFRGGVPTVGGLPYKNDLKHSISYIYDARNWNDIKISNGEGDEDFHCSRPTHALAIKWIRENFQLHIKVDWFLDNDNKIDWDFCIQKIGTDIDEKGNSEYLRNYSEETGYDSPEQAIEAALLYTLNHLI